MELLPIMPYIPFGASTLARRVSFGHTRDNTIYVYTSGYPDYPQMPWLYAATPGHNKRRQHDRYIFIVLHAVWLFMSRIVGAARLLP